MTDPIIRLNAALEGRIHNASEAREWFLRMMREHEEFEVETDEVGELAMPSWSETIRRVE